MDDLKKFFTQYWGAIIGGVLALILACTGLYQFIIGIILVCLGMWAGNYFQHYKDNVKNNWKNYEKKFT